MGPRTALLCFALTAACASTVSGSDTDARPPTDAIADHEPMQCPQPAGGPLRTPPVSPDAVVDLDEDVAFGCILRGDGRIHCPDPADDYPRP